MIGNALRASAARCRSPSETVSDRVMAGPAGSDALENRILAEGRADDGRHQLRRRASARSSRSIMWMTRKHARGWLSAVKRHTSSARISSQRPRRSPQTPGSRRPRRCCTRDGGCPPGLGVSLAGRPPPRPSSAAGPPPRDRPSIEGCGLRRDSRSHRLRRARSATGRRLRARLLGSSAWIAAGQVGERFAGGARRCRLGRCSARRAPLAGV